MKYIVIDWTETDCFDEEFSTAQEAIERAEIIWGKMSDYDKKRRTAFYVLESVNPDPDAENHYDGEVVKEWK